MTRVFVFVAHTRRESAQVLRLVFFFFFVVRYLFQQSFTTFLLITFGDDLWTNESVMYRSRGTQREGSSTTANSRHPEAIGEIEFGFSDDWINHSEKSQTFEIFATN